MSRHNLRPVFRWMPLWLLRLCFGVVVIVLLIPTAIWDALKGIFLTIRHDWRDLHDDFTDATSNEEAGPYLGQIMAECDCSRTDECEAAGRCLALDEI
jgi:hypothetical protein